MSHEQAELYRKLVQLIRLGTLVQLDHQDRKIKVALGEITNGQLPWPA